MILPRHRKREEMREHGLSSSSPPLQREELEELRCFLLLFCSSKYWTSDYDLIGTKASFFKKKEKENARSSTMVFDIILTVIKLLFT